MTRLRSVLIVSTLVGALTACDTQTHEVVYLDKAAGTAGADAHDWERFVKVIEVQSTAIGLSPTRVVSTSTEGCRGWMHTRSDSTISAWVDACPQVAWKAAQGAPCAIVFTWPPWGNAVAMSQAANWRAATYDALRAEFGTRVKVVHFDPALELE
jgi:hypothetical protein